ncbi:membrane protein [Gordonia phage SpeedDemon]|uniref:Uncharacterized protein n=1 Tax=Gordonia phage Bantam TaxID=1887641 RepID=A0A1B3AY99_9CAUD|nr:hypothetical protein BIZ77_gp143 [Gordonia phage Bantam]AOE43725.1 hypothetical protein SEA_BANTAM_35 [Gordonia phage Bantam]QNL30488.1 membrane protein [Gordonia phage SpeedDemon]
MSSELVNLFIGLGVGSIIVAVINGLFNRGSNKAAAAKLVTDTAKVANDMVREIADDIREDNEFLRTALAQLNTRFEETDRRLGIISAQLALVVRELEASIPLLDQAGHLQHADHLRQVVHDVRDEN